MDLTQPSTGIATLALGRPSRILTASIVALTIATSYIHLGLGGLLFTLKAAGYAALAAALVVVATVPHPLVARFAWAPRIGLAGYAATTIVAYLVMGPYFSLGWVAKAIGGRHAHVAGGRPPVSVRLPGRAHPSRAGFGWPGLEVATGEGRLTR